MADQPLAFHSDNIHSTKAHEKREVFVKVEEKKTFKQTAEEFQKKFAAAKAHAAESRAKIENPGADASGVIRSHTRRPFPVKTVLKIAIPLLILAGAGLAIYLNWPTIYHEFFEVSEEKATKLLLSDKPAEFIKMYDGLLEKATTPENKAALHLTRAINLEENYPGEYTEQCASDIYAAEDLYPSYTTAQAIITFEETYGSKTKAEEWRAKLDERNGKEIILGNG